MNLDTLDPKYRLILCDIWGVIHDGVTVDPRATKRLLEWKAEGRTIILITNAPRTADAVEAQLDGLGLPRAAWDGVATSGEAGIAALSKLPRPPGFLGTAADRMILEGRGITFSADGFTDLACTGLDEYRSHVDDYATDLERWFARDVLMHVEPKAVSAAESRSLCRSAADHYEILGAGAWDGKRTNATIPTPLILDGDPPRTRSSRSARVSTSMGAARQGIDCISSGGFTAAQFPPDFAAHTALGEAQWEMSNI